MQDQWTDRLSEYLDGDLDRRDRETLEVHLRECVDCRADLDDLRALLDQARSLEDRPPAVDLWPAIADRIAETPQDRGWLSGLLTGFGRDLRVTLSVRQLVMAAAALILVTTAVLTIARRTGSDGELVSVPDGAAPIAVDSTPGATLANFADPEYDAAVEDLRRTLEQERSRLDPRTIATVESNLAVIDEAIRQARQALESDPSNTYLNGYLADARRRKLDLLRRVAALAALES